MFIMNDNYNSFENVIEILQTYLPMCNSLRAEQIAMIVHNNGECHVYSGFSPEIYLLYTNLKKAGLDVQIRTN